MTRSKNPADIKSGVREDLGEPLYRKIESLAFERAEIYLDLMKKYDPNAKLIQESAPVRDMLRMAVMDNYFDCVSRLIRRCKRDNMYSFDIVRLISQNLPSEEETLENCLEQVKQAYFSAKGF